MVEKKKIGAAGLLTSGLLIGIGIVDPSVAGTLVDVFPIIGIQLVSPLPHLGDVVQLLPAGGWVSSPTGFLVAAFLTLAGLNLTFRVADLFQSS